MEICPNLLRSAAQVQAALHAAGIDSMAIGGLAVAIWGDPRVTRDIDLKVLIDRDQAERLVRADHDDALGVVRRQQGKLDDAYITSWLSKFEQALEDSTLVSSYRAMRSAEA